MFQLIRAQLDKIETFFHRAVKTNTVKIVAQLQFHSRFSKFAMLENVYVVTNALKMFTLEKGKFLNIS